MPKSENQFRYLTKYLRPHKTVIIISLFLSAASTALGMIQPYFAKILIDTVFMAREARLLLPLLVAVISLLVIGFIVRIINSYIYTLYSARLLFSMRVDLFEHLQSVPLTFLSKKKSGDIFSRIASDMADIQALMTDVVPHILFDLLTCVLTAGILLWLNWKMALMSFCFIPLALFLIHLVRPRLSSLAKSVAETNADIAHFLFESLAGAVLIRAFGTEKTECARLEARQNHMLKFLMRYQILGAFIGSVPIIAVIINTLIVFGYGGMLVFRDALTIGSLVAFSIYQGRVFAPLQGIMDGLLAIPKARVALGRVREIFDIEPACPKSGDMVPNEKQLRCELVFENVSFAYEPDEPVLENVSFSIPGGKITALVGPSGVGKTTICHLILRLFDPNAGKIALDGNDLKMLSSEWLRKNVVLAAQETFLFHASILENIRYAKPSASDEEVIEAAKAACVHDFIQSLPEGYHTLIGDRGLRLSGGQRQRLSIARALLLDPKILIMDEATAFLDNSVEDHLKEAIRGKARTIIVVSHRASTIQNADKVIALGKEGLLYEGPADQFPVSAGLPPADVPFPETDAYSALS